MPHLQLTKARIEALQPPPTGQIFHRDTGKGSVNGLAVRVTAGGTKAYVLEMLVKKKVRRMSIGRCSDLSVREAREAAEALRSKIAKGIDPTEEKRRGAVEAVTLEEAYMAYLARRPLSPRTVRDYDRVIGIALADWRYRPLAEIKRGGVEKRFERLRDEHGPAWANLCMRLLRAVFNFAAGKYADASGASPYPSNPVKVLSETRAWAKIERRRTLIKPHELAHWHGAVMSLANDAGRDYLLLLLFTGLRRREGASLKWSDIDLDRNTLTIARTKNGRPHTLPLPGYLHDMLEARRPGGNIGNGATVFPGAGSNTHRLTSLVTDACGIEFSLHDLRRTFITVAESLDIPAYTLKALLNHADGSDVTAGYIVATTERLRAPMQKIADYLERAMGIAEVNVATFDRLVGRA